MPHFDKYAYEDTNCYALKGKDLGTDAPWATVTKLLPVIRPGLGAVATAASIASARAVELVGKSLKDPMQA